MSYLPEYLDKKSAINCDGKLIDITNPIVMGILNITPDSFYDGGKYTEKSFIINRVKQILHEGAKIIDVGAYSSRPGAKHITEKEELERLYIALELIRKDFPEVIISVDTFRANVARKVVEEFKVNIINDISAGDMDSAMFEVIAELNVPYVMMHMKGTPQNMQKQPIYKDNVVLEVLNYLCRKVQELRKIGVHDIIIDPGFGFGKTLDHNYELLNKLNELKMLELPILVGISRKSMIYKMLENTTEQALNGTTALNMVALQKGANILRVHDVKEAMECVNLYNKLNLYK